MLRSPLRSTLPVGALVLALAGCGDDFGPAARCGDDVCSSSESAASCAADCGCGNGVANPGEACDGTDLGGATCASEGLGEGTLACNSDCTFDVSGCRADTCGNGVLDPGEDCEGTDLGGATCASIGFSAGEVACNENCHFDVSGCCNDFCSGAGTLTCTEEDQLEACVMQDNGCLALEVTDCAATGDICDDSDGVPMCICVDRCTAPGETRCASALAQTCTVEEDGCLNWVATVDCNATGQACALGPQGAVCVPSASGENCDDPYPITAGQNVIAWNAASADYLTSQPSCNSTALDGPDIVLSYTAGVDGIATFSMSKPTSARQVVVVSSAACGTVTPEVACVSDFSPSAIGDTFAVTKDSTYFFYIRDTTSGSAELDDPLVLTVSETDCAAYSNVASNLSPAHGSVIATTSVVLSADLDHPIDPTTGVITVTGDLGTTFSYDLSTSPPEVTFDNGNRSIQIAPAAPFKPGETITVSWSGLRDPFCGASIPPPTWTFDILTPSCTPGVGGMVGNTVTRLPTDITSISEYYVAPDSEPNGYVYIGGLSDLYRVPKAGGPTEDLLLTAGITSTQLGYTMAIVGGSIFTADSTTSTTVPFLWRLTINGGLTWNPLGYSQFPSTPGGTIKGLFHDDGRLYMVTDETSTGVPTEIWSVGTGGVLLPVEPVLEGTIAGEGDCDSITGDDTYFYLACADGDRIIRVNRTTYQSELITDSIDMSTTRNTIHAHDFDGDGTADALYVHTDEERVHYICSPASPAPFWVDVLAEFGDDDINYGLGFDPVNRELWAFDDDTLEFVSIK